MRHRAKKRIYSIILPLLAATATAQDTVDEALPEIRHYTVEMIIFSYDQNVSAGTEVFVPDAPPPLDPVSEDTAIDADTGELMSVPSVAAEIPEAEEQERPYEIVMLAEEDFTLQDAYARLDNLSAYTPLLHFGWTQPTYPEDDTAPRPLDSFVTPPEGLRGELKLYLSRYLHLAVNLQLDAPVDDNRTGRSGGRYASNIESRYDNAVVYPVRYRIEEDRIFRSGELRYFDHPKFGVLAKITRMEDEPGDEELLGEELLGFGAE